MCRLSDYKCFKHSYSAQLRNIRSSHFYLYSVFNNPCWFENCALMSLSPSEQPKENLERDLDNLLDKVSCLIHAAMSGRLLRNAPGSFSDQCAKPLIISVFTCFYRDFYIEIHAHWSLKLLYLNHLYVKNILNKLHSMFIWKTALRIIQKRRLGRVGSGTLHINRLKKCSF